MSDTQYFFGLKIKDKEIQLGGDRIFVETQMEKWLQLFAGEIPETLVGAHQTTAAAAAAGAEAARRIPTLVEFIKTKEPKALSDFVLVVGLYLERFQQKNLFTRSDLMNTIFARANKTEDEVQEALTTLVEQQFLTSVETMGSAEPSYSLTFTGEQVVKDGFDHT